MKKTSNLSKYLDELLKVKKYKDTSRNGLQVKAKNIVSKIAFVVDASMEAFENAKKQGCDLIIAHHGILWKGEKDPLKLRKKRIEFLRKNKISLYAAHYPLDIHPIYGNNSEIARLLSVDIIGKFGNYHGYYWGYYGNTKTTSSITIKNKLAKTLNTNIKLIQAGKKQIKKVAIVSGGAGMMFPEAKQKNIDLFITGEIKHEQYHKIKESKINLIAAGHYATETLGVKALQKHLKEKFNIPCIFIDIPTGL